MADDKTQTHVTVNHSTDQIESTGETDNNSIKPPEPAESSSTGSKELKLTSHSFNETANGDLL